MTMAAWANDIMYATKGRWTNCQMCDKLPTYRDLLSGYYQLGNLKQALFQMSCLLSTNVFSQSALEDFVLLERAPPLGLLKAAIIICPLLTAAATDCCPGSWFCVDRHQTDLQVVQIPSSATDQIHLFNT